MELKRLFKKYKEYYKDSSKISMEQQYFSLVFMKNIKILIMKEETKKKLDLDKINKEYIGFINTKVGLDNKKEEKLNNILEKVERNEYSNINFDKYIKNNINNKYINKKTKMVQVFNKLKVFLDKENQITKSNKYIVQNFVEDYSNNLESRKINNNLLKPHYFFTTNYNETIKPSQIRHWTSSIYSYLNKNNINTIYLDNFTSKLIKLFFNVKYLKKKLIWDSELIEGFKIKPNKTFNKYINKVIKYTSIRTPTDLKNESIFPRSFLKSNKIKDKLKYTDLLEKFIKQRKLNFYTGFYPKRKSYLRKLSRVLLSKPFFKHTSLNLIIDLFIYNNKRYKFKRIKNLTMRRSIYKYMYSMYVDYAKKIKQTINRPRFFYMNLIQPNLFNKYNNILSHYKFFFIKNNKSLLIYICILALKLNFNLKNIYNKYFNKYNINNTNYTNNIDNNNIDNNNIDGNNIDNNMINYNNNLNKLNREVSFKRLSKKRLNKNYLLLPFNTIRYSKNNLYNFNKNIAINIKEKKLQDEKKKIKNVEEKYYKDVLIKKYISELEKKSNKPINLNDLSLWKTDGLGSVYSTPTGKIINEKKNKKKISSKSYQKNRVVRDFREVFLRDQSIYNSNTGNKKKRIRDKNKIIIKYDLYDPESTAKFTCGVLLPLDQCNNEKFDWKKHVILTNEEDSSSLKMNKIRYNLDKKNYLLKLKSLSLNSKVIDKNKSIIINSNNLINNNNINNIDNNIDSKNIKHNLDKFKNDNIKIKYFNILSDIYNKNNDKSIKSNNLTINSVTSTFYLNNNKEIYLNNNKEINLNDKNYNENNNNLNIIISFNNINNNINLNKRKKSVLNKINKYYNIKIDSNIKRSKILWNNLDNSIFSILEKFIKISNKSLNEFSNNKFDYFYNNIQNLKGYGNIWYIFYFLSIIKKEYNQIYKDIIISKEYQLLPYSHNILQRKSYNENYNENENENYNENENENEDINKKIKNNNLYNESIFKYYYRSIISYSIIANYARLLHKMGNMPILEYLYNRIYNNFKNNLTMNYNIYNFVTVKILLDLIHYNYRSLIKVKDRYYYINKLRFYIGKYRRVNLNSWIASIRFVKKLRKTPKQFWFRFHILAYTFFTKIIRFSELNNKRNVLVPFVIYFEDILYTIYGKWVLIRLWPIKRYYLSSYILASRILTLILWRKRFSSNKYSFQRMTTKLIAGIRFLQIKKAYNFYVENSYRWPNFLIDKVSNNIFGKFNYKNLEYYNHLTLRSFKLENYIIPNYNLFSYFSSLKNRYQLDYINNIKLIRKSKNKRSIKFNKISNLQFMYYWLRPLKNYIITLNKSFDISGLKLRLSGRAGTKRNNLRSTYKNRIYGNLLGPIHFYKKAQKFITVPNHKLRGYARSNIDFALKVSKSKNGALSLKVWISSVFSSDLRELLLHLVKIKFIYSQLINRLYPINPYLIYIKNNYMIKSPNKTVNIKNKFKKKFEKWQDKSLPFYAKNKNSFIFKKSYLNKNKKYSFNKDINKSNLSLKTFKFN